MNILKYIKNQLFWEILKLILLIIEINLSKIKNKLIKILIFIILNIIKLSIIYLDTYSKYKKSLKIIKNINKYLFKIFKIITY